MNFIHINVKKSRENFFHVHFDNAFVCIGLKNKRKRQKSYYYFPQLWVMENTGSPLINILAG